MLNMNQEAWWERSGPVVRFCPNKGCALDSIVKRLPRIKKWGFSAIELLPPYLGFMDYAGLDVVDYFRPAPPLGDMPNFINLVEQCHRLGLRITAFLNLGYSALELPAFIKACRDVGQGIDSEEARCFIWSDTRRADAAPGDAPWFMDYAHGIWAFNETAGKYYWSKWRGDVTRRDLPQFDFASPQWQKECSRIIRFWLDTGLDGLVIDAVNWYTHCNWEINRSAIVEPAYRNKRIYLQPEGAGGFRDDPILWIQQGMYNSVQDYAINLWWEGHDVIGKALRSGNPSDIEPVLAGYRDRVVAAGGVTYACANWKRESTPEERLLELAVLVGAGELLQLPDDIFNLQWPEKSIEDMITLLTLQRDTPALWPAAYRIHLHTQDNYRFYSVLRTSADGLQQFFVIFNFTREDSTIQVTLPGSVVVQRRLPPLGYLFEQVHPAQ
jgi:hypothetical protein